MSKNDFLSLIDRNQSKQHYSFESFLSEANKEKVHALYSQTSSSLKATCIQNSS